MNIGGANSTEVVAGYMQSSTVCVITDTRSLKCVVGMGFQFSLRSDQNVMGIMGCLNWCSGLAWRTASAVRHTLLRHVLLHLVGTQTNLTPGGT
jgi:hypothetical protein